MKETEKTIVQAVGSIDKDISAIVKETEKVVEPYRKSVLHRFPVLFALLVTFGVVATLLGLERIITDIAWLNERPLLILGIGLCTLILTGRLYKKLG